jgi:hypothetical protein
MRLLFLESTFQVPCPTLNGAVSQAVLEACTVWIHAGQKYYRRHLHHAGFLAEALQVSEGYVGDFVDLVKALDTVPRREMPFNLGACSPRIPSEDHKSCAGVSRERDT